jgi:hypothetical protein
MDNEQIKNIFITNSDSENDNDISGRISATCILNTIPETALIDPIINWRKEYSTEWRWRFLKLNEKLTVEISYLTKINDNRLFYNRYGEWVEKIVPKEYNDAIVKTFYYYVK